jgi:hypothetical protein
MTNKLYLATPTYVSAAKLPSSGGRPKNHSYSRHPTTCTVSITIKATYVTNNTKTKLIYIFTEAHVITKQHSLSKSV